MDNLIQNVARQLSLDEAVVRRGIGQVFKYCQQQVPEDHRDWFAKVPGAESLIREERATEEEQQRTSPREQPKTIVGYVINFILWLLTAHFILDFIKSLLSPFLGQDKTVQLLDSVRGGAGLVDKLQGLGITAEQVTPLCQKVVAYMREHLGDDTVDDLLTQIPALGPLLGSTKKEE